MRFFLSGAVSGAVSGAALLAAGAAVAQTCAQSGEICALNEAGTRVYVDALSADGSVLVGDSEPARGESRALRWTEDGGLQDLGFLRAEGGSWASARDVSADGAVIVGQAEDASGDLRAFRWTEDGGMRDLGSFRADGAGDSSAFAISADGSAVVGWADRDAGRSRAFRWTEAEGLRDLGALSADGFVNINVSAPVSADGAVIVGAAQNEDLLERAFRWTQSGGMQDLGALDDPETGLSRAVAVSADGSTVVGLSSEDPYFEQGRAFRWTESGGMQDLGGLGAEGAGDASASAVSADGSVVVGSATNVAGDLRAFRWVEGEGLQDLGGFGPEGAGGSAAYAVSADGAVVVGSASEAEGASRAFRWTQSGGLQDLGALNAGGWSSANHVSADGSVVVGSAGETPEAYGRAFIWRASEGGNGGMEDLANLRASFPILVHEVEVSAAAQQAALSGLAEQDCGAFAGGLCLGVSGSLVRTGGDSASGVARSGHGAAALSLGYGLTDQISLGGGAALLESSVRGRAVESDPGLGLALWGGYSQGGAARTGLQGEAAVVWGRQEAEISRGTGVENVILARGESDLETTLARASLGYGVEMGGGWLATPSLALEHARSRMDGYAESGASFNARYDSLKTERTTLTAALSGEAPFGASGVFSLGVGVAQDLDAGRARVSGASDLPGLTSFDLESALNRRETRGFASLGYRHAVSPNAALSLELDAGQAAYGGGWSFGAEIGYGVRF